MDKFYYLVSQLPLLYFDKDTFVDIDFFLEEAEKWTNTTEYNKLVSADINETEVEDSDPEVLKEFKKYERKFRKDVAEFRKAQKEGYEYKTSLFPNNVLKEGTPLEIEKNLIKLRWNFLEGREHEHDFDLGFLIIYYLKLQYLRRLESFEKEEGMKKFKKYTEVEL